eukprot:scaffold403146_cov43-Prasinocladus_malaysianus.AAC.1
MSRSNALDDGCMPPLCRLAESGSDGETSRVGADDSTAQESNSVARRRNSTDYVGTAGHVDAPR